MAGFSYRMGYDTIKYEEAFYYFSDELLDIKNEILLNSSREPGWTILNVLINSIFGKFEYLKIAIAIFVNVTIFWFFKKHLFNPALGIMIYALLSGWTINYEILRASIAIAFFLIAFDKLLNDKPKYAQFFIIFFPALFFHWFAFLMLLTPLFFILRPNRTYLITVITCAIVTPLLIQIGVAFSSLGYLNELLGERVDIYLTGEAFGSRGLNINGVIYTLMTSAVPVIIICYLHKAEINNKIIAISLCYALLCVLRLGLDILYRITDYYAFVLIILLSHVVSRFRYSKYKFIDLTCILLLSISTIMTLTADNTWPRYVPFTSIIDKQIVYERELLYDELSYN